MVLMLTAAATPEDRVAGLCLGADDYLVEALPLSTSSCCACVPSHGVGPRLRRRVLRAADIELDPLRHTATRGDRVLELSAKEFGVLEALLAVRWSGSSAPNAYLNASGTNMLIPSPRRCS